MIFELYFIPIPSLNLQFSENLTKEIANAFIALAFRAPSILKIPLTLRLMFLSILLEPHSSISEYTP